LTFITGIWNLGQAAFYSIGAYTLVLIMQRISISFWLCLPLVAVLALVIALLLGPITLRVKGVYFCILSLSFVEVTRLTYIYTRSANDRVMRASPIPPIAIGNLLKIDFSADRLSFYYLVLFFVVLTMIFLSRVDRSRLGQILRSIEKNELLAQSVGVNTLFYKVVAFAICSFFAGLAGGLFATYNVVITPTSFTSWLSMLFIVHIVVGGLNSTYGPAVGTMLLTVLPEYLPFDPLEIKIVYGLLLILTVSLLPAGLTSIPERIKAYSLKRKLKKASIT
jgi:branched-chain amino acid transport system permease protein